MPGTVTGTGNAKVQPTGGRVQVQGVKENRKKETKAQAQPFSSYTPAAVSGLCHSRVATAHSPLSSIPLSPFPPANVLSHFTESFQESGLPTRSLPSLGCPLTFFFVSLIVLLPGTT